MLAKECAIALIGSARKFLKWHCLKCFANGLLAFLMKCTGSKRKRAIVFGWFKDSCWCCC